MKNIIVLVLMLSSAPLLAADIYEFQPATAAKPAPAKTAQRPVTPTTHSVTTTQPAKPDQPASAIKPPPDDTVVQVHDCPTGAACSDLN